MIDKIRQFLKTYNIFKQSFRKHKNKLVIMAILGFAGGLMGGIGIGAVIPLFAFVIKNGQPISDPISALITGFFSFVGLSYRLRYLIILIGLLFTFKAGFLFLANYISYRAMVDYEKEARQEIFEHVMRADWPHLLKQKIGHLSTVVMDNISAASSLLNSISVAILFLTSLITYAIVALNISLNITLLTFAIGFVLFLILRPFFKKIRQSSQRGVLVFKDVSHFLSQHIIGAKTIKTMAVEKEVLKKSEFYFREFGTTRLRIYKFNSALRVFLEPITLAVIIPIFALSYHNPDFNIASFAVILYLVQKMFSFMQSLQMQLSYINEGIPHLTSVLDYQSEAIKYKEKDIGGAPFSFKSTIEFQGVDFYYNPDGQVLNGVSLKINKGETVGLIGPSGSGKTTLVDLILRLLLPTGGRLIIDGKDVADINLTYWRKHIGYVSQDIFLLNDTIENNIRFYNYKINNRQIAEAAKRAQIYDFIMEQSKQFKTEVGERGLQLSVGQRQRVVLARILASSPEILILDEATSALDNESEAAIQDAIAKLHGQMTIIMIAHRLTTVMNADKIIVLDRGKIIEGGKPDDLLKNKDSYFYKTYHIN